MKIRKKRTKMNFSRPKKVQRQLRGDAVRNASPMPRPSRLDPSRTLMLRKALIAEFRKRFARLRLLVWQAVVDNDWFGLAKGVQNAESFFGRCERDDKGRCLSEAMATQKIAKESYSKHAETWPNLDEYPQTDDGFDKWQSDREEHGKELSRLAKAANDANAEVYKAEAAQKAEDDPNKLRGEFTNYTDGKSAKRRYVTPLAEAVDRADRSLTGEAKEAIDYFVGANHDSLDRGAVSSGIMMSDKLEDAYKGGSSEVRQQLEEKVSPIKEMLRKQFGDSVELYRFQAPVKEGSQTRMLLSYTANPKFARWHGSGSQGEVVKQNVPIDRIAWVTDRMGQSEFIVKTEHVANYSPQGPNGNDLPDVRQRQSWDCGAAVSFSVGQRFGVGPNTLGKWRDLLGSNEREGTRPHRIETAFEELGLSVSTTEGMTLGDLAEATEDGSVVVCPVQKGGTEESQRESGEGHWVAVTGVRDGRVYFQDPAHGPRDVTEEGWLERWHDVDASGTEWVRFGIAIGPKEVTRNALISYADIGYAPKDSSQAPNGGLQLPPWDASLEDGGWPKITLNTIWNLKGGADKVKSFRLWLKKQIDQNITGVSDEELLRRFAVAGYKKGIGRAYDDANRVRRTSATDQPDMDHYQGGREQFLRDSFAQPVAVERLKQLVDRSYTDLKGVTEQMSVQMTRTLADGLAQGKNPKVIARELNDRVDKIGRVRAESIARTECLPSETLVDAAVVRAVFRRWYVGPMVEIVTSSGRKFSATPNHPMLTTEGWIGAGSLNNLHCLIRSSGNEDSSSSRNMNIHGGPTTIGEIFDSLNAVGVLERKRTGFPDFHGDGMDGEVDVLCADGELRIGAFAPVSKELVEPVLSLAGQSCPAFCRLCSNLLPVNEHLCLICGSQDDAGLNQPSLDDPPVQAKHQRQRTYRLPRDVSCTNVSNVDVGSVLVGDSTIILSEFLSLSDGSADTLLAENLPDLLLLGTNGSSDLSLGHPREVEIDYVASVTFRPFAGHVYNLETSYGYYSILGYYTGNCSRAHSEGQLDAVEGMGMDSVGVEMEWLTSGEPCSACAAMAGNVYSVKDARGKIPAHPGCLCCWVPNTDKALTGNANPEGCNQYRSCPGASVATPEQWEEARKKVLSRLWGLEDAGKDSTKEYEALSVMYQAVGRGGKTPPVLVHDGDGNLVAAGSVQVDSNGASAHVGFVGSVKRGAGSEAMRLMIDEARKAGAREVSMDASPDAVNLGRKFGFVVAGKLTPNGTPMKLALNHSSQGTDDSWAEFDPGRIYGDDPFPVTNEEENCGTGAGGFQPGNTCGSEGGSTTGRTGKKEQMHAEENKRWLAAALGGQTEEEATGPGQIDKKPFDVRVRSREGNRDIELKTIMSRKDNAISVHDDALHRKALHVEANPGTTFHTVVIDDRETWEGGQHSGKFSGHRIYYQRGSKKMSTGSMHRVKSVAELKRLLAMADGELPEKARGSLPESSEIAAKAMAEAAYRTKRDKALKERKKDVLKQQAKARSDAKKAAKLEVAEKGAE